MTKELDDLLSSLMQDLEKEQKKLPGQATRSTASEGARMRVEAILRDVERDTEKKEELNVMVQLSLDVVAKI